MQKELKQDSVRFDYSLAEMQHPASAEIFQVHNDLFSQKVSIFLCQNYRSFSEKLTKERCYSDALLHKCCLPHNDNIQRITVGDVCVEITAVIGVLPEYETKIIIISCRFPKMYYQL